MASKILIVDDETRNYRAIQSMLELDMDVEFDTAPDGVDCLEKCKNNTYDLIMLDISMPRKDGIQTLTELKELYPDTPVIMISANSDIKKAVDCMNKGAFYYLTKPFVDRDTFIRTVTNALDKALLTTQVKKLDKENTKLKKKANVGGEVQEILGESEAVIKVRRAISNAARVDCTTLITGPNGTGKELIAKWIHSQSDRAMMPFISLNCAAIPSELIESTLFGHTKGSFTGAVKDAIGYFEQAQGGTLFLDEIGDMSYDTQAKILLALENRIIKKVGGDKEIAVDIRILAATNKDLNEMVRQRLFREDLLNRLNINIIKSPALNSRREDIPLLANFYMNQICDKYGMVKKQLLPDAIDELMKIDWTGNIRQLRNAMEYLVVNLYDTEKITATDIEDYRTQREGKLLMLQLPEHISDAFANEQEFLAWAVEEYRAYKKSNVVA